MTLNSALSKEMVLSRRPHLNVRNSENFHDALIAQYKELIQEAILESETEHKTRMDIGKLNSKLQVIYKAAQFDGLNDAIISDLIDNAIPMNATAHAA